MNGVELWSKPWNEFDHLLKTSLRPRLKSLVHDWKSFFNQLTWSWKYFHEILRVRGNESKIFGQLFGKQHWMSLTICSVVHWIELRTNWFHLVIGSKINETQSKNGFCELQRLCGNDWKHDLISELQFSHEIGKPQAILHKRLFNDWIKHWREYFEQCGKISKANFKHELIGLFEKWMRSKTRWCQLWIQSKTHGIPQKILFEMLEVEFQMPFRTRGIGLHHHSVQVDDRWRRVLHMLLVKDDRKFLFRIHHDQLFQIMKSRIIIESR